MQKEYSVPYNTGHQALDKELVDKEVVRYK